MAAYAALVTLMNLMDQIQNHPRHSFSFDRKQIQSLLENVSFLLDFVEGHSSHGVLESQIASAAHGVLESQIASAAHAAEDAIESQVVDQILAGSTIHHAQKSPKFLLGLQKPIKGIKKKVMKAISIAKSPSFLPDLQKIIEDMDSIKEKVVKVKDERRYEDQQPIYSIPSSSSRHLTKGKTTMVGFDDYLIQLLDVLTGQQPSLQIISIAGMGGIGKTTLARNVYEDPLVLEHFDFHAWATISQEYDAREILLELLCSKGNDNIRTVDELGEQLYKKLSGTRYLIVLDDMWSNQVWDEIRFFFPDNGSRSRIVVTTRLSKMDCHSSLVMNFLDEDRSWKLFCQKLFGEDQDCPLELVKIGKEIVEQCRGLPLSIVVIGGHLRRSPRTEEYWGYIAKDINLILTSGDEQCLEILYLSYNHLPPYLKPYFLYTGVFREDKDIDASILTRLWVADGFIKPNRDQVLEEIAECHLQDLVDRNLILVREWSRNGKIKTCNVHDLLRELCLRVAEKEKFLCVLKSHPRPLDNERRVAIHGDFRSDYFHNEVFYALKSAHLVRSMICKPGLLPFHFKLLKILTMGREDIVRPEGCLEAKFQQVNLRYLSHKLNWQHDDYYMSRALPFLYLPSSISLLWNLQTLIIRGHDVKIMAPSEIWEMPQLRHMEFDLISLPDPPQSHDQQDDFVLLNLQTLLKVGNFKMSDEVCKRIPNIKKLEIPYDREALNSRSDYFQHNLGRSNKLESLDCHFLNRLNWRKYELSFTFPIWLKFASSLTFPSSLRKLYMKNSCLQWEDLTAIGSLPNLEVLRLDSVLGSEWSPVEGEFLRLKCLELEFCNELINWNAESSHFPILEELSLRGLSKLNEIPSGIGEVATLKRIDLKYCSVALGVAAMRILVEQEELGNEGLQLLIEFWDERDMESFSGILEEEGLTSTNLHRSKYKI